MIVIYEFSLVEFRKCIWAQFIQLMPVTSAFSIPDIMQPFDGLYPIVLIRAIDIINCFVNVGSYTWQAIFKDAGIGQKRRYIYILSIS